MNFTRIHSDKEWNRLLNKSCFKTFFHKSNWEGFLEQEFRWIRFEHYVYERRALLSLARRKNKLVSHPFCEYGGVIPLAEKINVSRFQRDLFSEFNEKIRISFHPLILDFIDLPKKNVPAVSERLRSYFIKDFDKKDKINIWKNLRKTVQQTIKKAANQGLEIRQCRSRAELKEIYRLYLMKTRRHRVPAYPFSFFQYFLRSLDSEIILAVRNNKIAAGSIFLFYDKCVHYFLNASDERPDGANHLILWSRIRKYAGRDFRVFDLGGTRKGSNLEIFKSGWGSSVFPILEMKNYSDKHAESVDFLRNFWAYLPIRAIEIFSPYFLKFKF